MEIKTLKETGIVEIKEENFELTIKGKKVNPVPEKQALKEFKELFVNAYDPEEKLRLYVKYLEYLEEEKGKRKRKVSPPFGICAGEKSEIYNLLKLCLMPYHMIEEEEKDRVKVSEVDEKKYYTVYLMEENEFFVRKETKEKEIISEVILKPCYPAIVYKLESSEVKEIFCAQEIKLTARYESKKDALQKLWEVVKLEGKQG